AVYCLSCSEEAHELMSQAFGEFANQRNNTQVPNSKIFFLGRENFPKTFGAKEYKLEEAQILASQLRDKNVTLVTCGSLVSQALKVAEILQQKNIGCEVVNLHSLSHIDVATIQQSLEKTKGNLLTLEDHQKIGGMSQMLISALAEKNVSFQVRIHAVDRHFGQSAYLAEELYKKHHLDALSVVESAMQLLN
ncbi:MAG: transketolase, partial [Bdellovibrionales bacterium]|nr:transketolase [Bdellovibrionales bacterium]